MLDLCTMVSCRRRLVRLEIPPQKHPSALWRYGILSSFAWTCRPWFVVSLRFARTRHLTCQTCCRKCQLDSGAIRVNISPSDFVGLVLPVYKAMFSHALSIASLFKRANNRAFCSINHHSSASFGRVLAFASRRLCLGTMHFEAALDAVRSDSGLILATNLQQEQVSYHAHVLRQCNWYCYQ